MPGSQKSREELIRDLEILQDKNRSLEDSLQSLKKDLSRHQDLIDYAADAIFMGDPEGNIIGANQSATTLSGFSDSELKEMNLGQLFSEAERQRAPLRYDLLKEGKTVKTERLLTRKNGSIIPVEMHSRMLPDRTYHSFMRDMSEHKQAEEALRISEEKFSRIFKLSPDAVALSRMEDGSYLEVNQGFTDMVGWTQDEVFGRSSRQGDLNIWCEEKDREDYISTLRKRGEVKEMEIPFRRKNGQIAICLMSARTIKINNELCILSIVHEITQRKKLQEHQRQLELQMHQVQKLESLGVLAGGIAHDFNNILMAVIGHCELALRRLSVKSPALENLRQIKLAAGKATDLANQMLAYSGRGKFVTEPLNLSLVIEEMEHILAVSVSKKALIRYELSQSQPTIEADVTQLRQIIMNLVINASDAIGDENGIISVLTGDIPCDRAYLRSTYWDEDLPEGQYAYLEVTDSGCGMTEETIARIFEPFFSTKFTGRGLGMAAVLGIVRGHKGAIRISSKVGKGSTFIVLFPALTQAVNIPAKEEPPSSLKDSGLVLLVDDEEIVLSIGKEMLEEFGFEVITAVDGQDAVTVFQEHHNKIRFVLMDMTMPNMDGVEAFQELRRIDPAVKVIICSGYNEQEISQRFVRDEVAGFLKKPYQISELQNVIQGLA